MPQIGSSLAMGQNGLPLINPTSIAQLAGVKKYLSRSAFDAAVTQERANITNNGTGIWVAGEEMSIFGEAGTRIWFVGTASNGSDSHARNVSYLGKTYTLAADSNVFGVTTGAPASGTGANGDYAVDGAAGVLYGLKAAGTWPAGVAAVSVPIASTTAVGLAPARSGSATTYLDGTGAYSTPASGGSGTAGSTPRVVTASATLNAGDYFTASNNTSGQSISITLPASPIIGQLYVVTDYSRNANGYNITVLPNTGQSIIYGANASANPTITTTGGSRGLFFISATTAQVVF